MDSKLLEILVCPKCKGNVKYIANSNQIVCPKDNLAFKIKNEIPIMLLEEAENIDIE